MKRKFLVMLLAIGIIGVTLTGCDDDEDVSYEESSQGFRGSYSNGYFTEIQNWDDGLAECYIVYANDTKVKYFVKTSRTYNGYHVDTITPLFNADGTCQVYEE